MSVRSLALIGGGRWGRVLMSVLQSVAPSSTEISWVTRANANEVNKWAGANASRSIAVVNDVPSDTEAAIVANLPHEHAGTIKRLLQSGVHTFCEKPFVLDSIEAQGLIDLAVQQNLRLGVELVLHYACYARDFAQQVASLSFDRIELDWQDPWSEQRYGETKLGAVYSRITEDMLPHCWSLIRLIAGNRVQGVVTDVSYASSACQVFSSHDGFDAMVTLGRRSQRGRVREIRLFQSGVTEPIAKLDFSVEPGRSEIEGREHQYQWRTERPLTRSLQSFLEAIEDSDFDWPLSADRCLPSVFYTQQATAMMKAKMERKVVDICVDGFREDNPEHVATMVDYFAPVQAQEYGLRHPLTTEQQVIDFARKMASTVTPPR